MTLALLSHDDMLPPPAQRQKALSQWWTPDETARRIVQWAGPLPHGSCVLEPSAGGGSFVRAALARHKAAHITAIEIDPLVAPRLRAIEEPLLDVVVADYMTWRATQRFARVYINPPYEGGADGRHVAKAMDESDEVVALVRLAALAGAARGEQVWSQVGGGEWWLKGLAIFSSRPVFLAAGSGSDGGKTDFCAVHLTRRERFDARQTHVEWW